LELALAAGAETIVSSDDDLLVLDPWRGVRILRPAEYLISALPDPVFLQTNRWPAAALVGSARRAARSSQNILQRMIVA
jgi:hypothetical protein